MAKPVEAGECRVFIGVRSDPFFADGEGAFHDFQFTGEDTFAGKNILCMALEVPNDMLGPGAEIGVWVNMSVRRDGQLVQVDRYGNPSFNPFFVDELKNQFNAGHPADDVADYLEPWSKLLESRGYPPAEARETALTVLPDIIHYDRNRPAHYPNGRVLTDDVYDMRMEFLTYGRVTSDGVGPHDDYLTEFPFLGVPNAKRRARPTSGLAHIRASMNQPITELESFNAIDQSWNREQRRHRASLQRSRCGQADRPDPRLSARWEFLGAPGAGAARTGVSLHQL